MTYPRKRNLITMLVAVALAIMTTPPAQLVFASSHGKTSYYIHDVSLSVSGRSTSRPVASSGCARPAACAQAMLHMINQDRAKRGVAPLTLKSRQSHGNGSCVGSIGHSQAMQQSGDTWHSNPSYRAASFPNDICISYTRVGENVGEASSSDELTDLQQLDNLMMAEVHDPATCSTTINHACNIINPKFHQVGVGIVHANNVTWLTEDFAG